MKPHHSVVPLSLATESTDIYSPVYLMPTTFLIKYQGELNPYHLDFLDESQGYHHEFLEVEISMLFSKQGYCRWHFNMCKQVILLPETSSCQRADYVKDNTILCERSHLCPLLYKC